MSAVSRGIDRVEVLFDDDTLVANAGLLLVASLSARLGLEALIDQTVRLVGRVGGSRPGRKVEAFLTSRDDWPVVSDRMSGRWRGWCW